MSAAEHTPDAAAPAPWRPGKLVHLESPRFVIRSLTREDVGDAFIGWLADPEVMIGMNLPRRRLSRTEAVAYVLSVDHRRSFRLGIQLRDGGALIGCFSVDVDPLHGWGETAVVVGERSWWGKDVVREARARLLDFLFDEVGLHRVMGRPHGRHFASIYNYKVLGFRLEGVLRQHLQAQGGEGRLDQLVFGLLRSEWQARRERLRGGAQ